MDDHSSAALVAKAVKLPTRTSGLKCPCGGLRCRGLRPCRGPFHARFLFGIAPGGACHAVLVAKTAVGSYPTVSPSPWNRAARPRTMAVSSLWRFPWGCPRWALPSTLPSWSPDFPRVRLFRHWPRGHPAIRAKSTYDSKDCWSTAKLWARAASQPSNAPRAHGRNRNRKAASSAASGPSG